MESGEYFLSASQKRSTVEKEKAERQKEVLEAKKRKREDPYLPPKVSGSFTFKNESFAFGRVLLKYHNSCLVLDFVGLSWIFALFL